MRQVQSLHNLFVCQEFVELAGTELIKFDQGAGMLRNVQISVVDKFFMKVVQFCRDQF
jgi:hypothetical protein